MGTLIESKINELSKNIIKFIKKAEKPALRLPKFLILCSALRRPGMSSMDISSKIIRRFQGLGIQTGDNTDGSPNLINAAVYAIVNEIVHSIKFDHVVNSVIPRGALQIMSIGNSPGGPVTSIGRNTTELVIKGF